MLCSQQIPNSVCTEHKFKILFIIFSFYSFVSSEITHEEDTMIVATSGQCAHPMESEKAH